jgi:hypothetical protein
MPQLVPEMILERCNETEHHESGCLLGVVSCQFWPIWMLGCFPALVAQELPAGTRPTPATGAYRSNPLAGQSRPTGGQ